MTKDLEETLAELGPGYRELVGRVQAAYRGCGEGGAGRQECRPSGARGMAVRWTVAYLVAASLLVFLGLSVLFREPEVRVESAAKLVYTVAYAPDESALAAIVASQHADGSWSNDFLTRQNAAALRGSDDPVRRIAYRKALRYLRTRGLRPLSDSELKQRGDLAARILAHA